MIDSKSELVTDQARDLLSVSPIADVRRVQVQREGDRILLQGRVRSFYAKQMAQETVRQVIGKLLLVNSVSVD